MLKRDIYFYPNDDWLPESPTATLVLEKCGDEYFLHGSLKLATALDIHGPKPFMSREDFLIWNNGE